MSVVARSPVSVARPSSSGIPALSAATCSPVKADRNPMAYSRSTPCRGWRTRSAHAPSLVRTSRPSESWSRRPTGKSRPPSGTSAVGIMSSTVFDACRSRTVEVTPAGLWSSRYSGADAEPITRPSTAMTDVSGSTCIPSRAALPSTVTRPFAIRTSLARRDATPAAARTFWSRSTGIRSRSRSLGRQRGRHRPGRAAP